MGYLCNDNFLIVQLKPCMIKNLLFVVWLGLSAHLTLCAQTPIPLLTVNGSVVEHALASITFSGDNVILHFSDGTADRTEDMGVVTIDMTSVTAVGKLKTFSSSQLVGNTLTLGGLAAGDRVTLFDAQGRRLLQTTAQGNTMTLPLDHLRPAVYIVRAGNNIIKFQKR